MASVCSKNLAPFFQRCGPPSSPSRAKNTFPISVVAVFRQKEREAPSPVSLSLSLSLSLLFGLNQVRQTSFQRTNQPTSGRYPFLTHLASLGRDQRWTMMMMPLMWSRERSRFSGGLIPPLSLSPLSHPRDDDDDTEQASISYRSQKGKVNQQRERESETRRIGRLISPLYAAAVDPPEGHQHYHHDYLNHSCWGGV